MVTVDTLKHNKFRKVSIPKPSELVKAYGLHHPGNRYSGDEVLNPNENKIDQVSKVAKEAFEE